MWFIGDLHREWKTYEWMINKMTVGSQRPEDSCHWFDDMPASMQAQASMWEGTGLDESLQVGDWGIFTPNCFERSPGNDKHRFFRGNHDNPELCNEHPAHLGDFGYIQPMEMFFLAGGLSIDQYRRTEHIDWWPNEQLTASQWWRVGEMWGDLKPKIVASHECPGRVKAAALAAGGINVNTVKKVFTSATEVHMDELLEIHEPDIWIFGHYHYKMDQTFGKTRFVCVGSVNIAPLKDTIFEIPGLTWPEKMDIIT